MRTAFDHLARNFDLGLAWIVAPLLDSAPRVFRNAAGFRRVSIVLLREPVGGPFPYIADHVVNAVTVRRERGHREVRSKPSPFRFCRGKSPCQVLA